MAPVRFGYGSGVERFKRFRFSVLAVPLQKGFAVFQYSLTGRLKFPVPAFRFLENGSGGSGSAFPKGPKIEKIQDRPPGLKFSIEIEIFKRTTQQTPIFSGEF